MHPLKPGDTIGFISPASRAEAEIFSAITHTAEQRGYKVKVFGVQDSHVGRFAAADDIRARNLVKAFSDDTVDMVHCVRGGYGSSRLLDHLDLSRISSKIFVGYSDVTSLLLHLQANVNLVPFHGPMATDLAQKSNSNTLDWFFSVLEGRRFGYDLGCDHFTPHQKGTARGPVWGGNISMIESLLGTDSIRVPDNAILVLEDVNEFMYALDRALVHLRRAGVFDTAQAILFADMRMKDAHDRDNSLGLLLDEVISLNFPDFHGPIAHGLPCGHTDMQMTFPLGAEAQLEVGENQLSLVFDDFWNRPLRRPLAA